MTHPMLEKIALGMAQRDKAGWHGLPDWVKTHYERLARTAVQAMLDPTPDMLKAADQIERFDQYSWPTPDEAWPVMLKVVLGEERARDRIDV